MSSLRRPAYRIAFIAVTALILSTACRPTLLYLGDPAQKGSLPSVGEFEDRLRRGARSEGYRTEVEWFDEIALGEIDALSRISESAPAVVAMSPYLSLLAGDVEAGFPTTRIIRFAVPTQTVQAGANTTVVAFTVETALASAATFVSDWIAVAAGRRAGIVAANGPTHPTDEADRFESLLRVAGVEAIRVDIESRQSREDVRSALRPIGLTADTLVAIFAAGEIGTWVLESLQNEAAPLLVFGADASGTVLPVIASIHQDVVDGIDAALTNGPGQLTVESRLTILGESE